MDSKYMLPDYSKSTPIGNLPTSTNKYTAPYNCLWIVCFNTNTSAIMSVYINNTEFKRGSHTSYRENQSIMTFPLRKGDVVYWSVNATILYTNSVVPYAWY